MKNGFNNRDFINYFVYEKPAKNENPRRLLSEMLEKILEYAHKNEHNSKDQFIYFLLDILPAMDFGEIAQFANDEILTAYGRAQKFYYLTGKEARGDD